MLAVDELLWRYICVIIRACPMRYVIIVCLLFDVIDAFSSSIVWSLIYRLFHTEI